MLTLLLLALFSACALFFTKALLAMVLFTCLFFGVFLISAVALNHFQSRRLKRAPWAVCALATLLLFSTLHTAQAQTVTAGTNTVAQQNAQTFLESVQGYFSSFDTNSTTFQKTNELDLWTGYDYVNNVNSSSSLGIEYTVYKPFAIEAVVRNAGIAGTLLSLQGGASISKVVYDVKLSGFVDLGEDFAQKGMYVALGGRVKKALTANTFAGTGLEFHIGRQTSPYPTLSIFAGFTL